MDRLALDRGHRPGLFQNLWKVIVLFFFRCFRSEVVNCICQRADIWQMFSGQTQTRFGGSNSAHGPPVDDHCFRALRSYNKTSRMSSLTRVELGLKESQKSEVNLIVRYAVYIRHMAQMTKRQKI